MERTEKNASTISTGGASLSPMKRGLLLHVLFSLYVTFGHPFFAEAINDVQKHTTQHIFVGLFLLALVAAEHFAARGKLRHLIIRYRANGTIPQQPQKNERSGLANIFLWIVHLLGIIVMSLWGISALFGSDIEKIPLYFALPLYGLIVVKDILFVFVDPYEPELNKMPKHPEWLYDAFLLVFAFFMHSVFWGIMISDPSSFISRPFENSIAAVTAIFIVNVLGITLLFLMSYCASRTLFIGEEYLRSRTEGRLRVVLPYLIAVVATVASVYRAASGVGF